MDKDYCSIDSGYLETLNILRPPVKRVRRNNQGDYLDVSDSAKVQFGGNITKVYRSQEQSSKHDGKKVRSSLSLVLQKTCKKQIYETYSYINPESIQRTKPEKNSGDTEKPLLKITVIPKTDQQPLMKLLENNNNVANKLKRKTIESCYQTKNLYLIVAGGKKEKIYKVKTTSSCKTLRETNLDDVEILKASSNEMEKKKKKPSKETNFKRTERVCSCKECLHNNLAEDVIGKSSRVHIFGHLGLDKNDEYVLKCAATVNGQPVPTNSLSGFQQEGENPLLNIYSVESRFNKTKKQSQATQVDINISDSKPYDINEFKDQKIQCNLCKIHNYEENNTDEEPSNHKVKASSSPLVIISIYPNQELNNVLNQKAVNTFLNRPIEEFRVNNFEVDASLTNTNKLNSKYNSKKTDTVSSNFTIKRDTSYSPRKNQHKNETQIKLITSNSKDGSTNRRQSPQRSRDQTFKTKMDQRPTNRENRKQNNKNVTKLTSHFAGTKEVGRKQNVNAKSQWKPRDKNISKITTTVTDKAPKKKSNLMKQNNQRKDQTKNEEHIASPRYGKTCSNNNFSKVSVNIDSEKEYYDVIFEKGQFNTDLFVRKSIKDYSSKKSVEDKFVDNVVRQTRKDNNFKIYLKNNVDNEFDSNLIENNKDAQNFSEENFDEKFDDKSDSLENFFHGETSIHHRRSASQAFNSLPYSEGSPTNEHASGLYVRDSLEVSHRRDARDSKIHSEKYVLEYDSNEEAVEEFNTSVPKKHFDGDNCLVKDPVQRDKEIRELLGIHKNKKQNKVRGKDNKQNEDNDDYSIDDDIIIPSTQHPFHNALCKILVTNLRIRKSCSCPSCTRKKLARAGKINTFNYLKINEKSQSNDKDFIHIEAVVRSREEIKKIDTNNKIRISLMKSHSTQYETLEKILECSSVIKRNQQHINIQTNSKPRTIKLSRTQYRKVKQSLRKCQQLRFRMNWNSSIVSIGEIKTKTKSNYMMYCHKEVQTAQTDPDTKKLIANVTTKCTTLTDIGKCNDANKPKVAIKERKDAGDSHTVVLFARECGDEWNKTAKRTVSSVEMHINSVIRLKDLKASYANFTSLGTSNQERKRRNSTETIFRDTKICRSPNLGTSAVSLQTENAKTVSKSETLATGLKPRKPFLRRLMSCLVMRTARASEIKLGQVKQRTPTISSSFDSYHINTSLGAIEMSTSLYDTADSFYTNYSVGPTNNKTKRGFFSSVRGFLTSRKN